MYMYIHVHVFPSGYTKMVILGLLSFSDLLAVCHTCHAGACVHLYDIEMIDHSNRMELWPGYVSSISEYDGGLLLLFDVSHKLLRTDTALDFLWVVVFFYQRLTPCIMCLL